jgi:hypothetical protein
MISRWSLPTPSWSDRLSTVINENGPVLAAVPSQVPLPVAVNVEPRTIMKPGEFNSLSGENCSAAGTLLTERSQTRCSLEFVWTSAAKDALLCASAG